MLILLTYDGDPGDLVAVDIDDFKKIHELIMRWIKWVNSLPLQVYEDDEFDGTFVTFLRNKGYSAYQPDYQQVSGNDGHIY